MGLKLRKAFLQFGNLFFDLRRLTNRHWWRWITCWLPGGIGYALLSYRSDRFLYLFFGEGYTIIRPFFSVLFWIFGLLGCRLDIHYMADIGPGFKILHPSLGVVVSGMTTAGKNLELTGGNCIGVRRRLKRGELSLGDDIQLGANAVVLGPARIGNRVRIGAGAVVVGDLPDDTVAIGVPARVNREE